MVDVTQPLFLDDGTPVTCEYRDGPRSSRVMVRFPPGKSPVRPGRKDSVREEMVLDGIDTWHYDRATGVFVEGDRDTHFVLQNHYCRPNLLQGKRRMVFND